MRSTALEKPEFAGHRTRINARDSDPDIPLCTPADKSIDPGRAVSLYNNLGGREPQLVGMTCGQMEFQVNAFTDDAVDDLLYYACCEPREPIANACQLCANGAQPINPNFVGRNTGDDYDIPCSTLFYIWPNYYTTSSPECNTESNPESVNCCKSTLVTNSPTPAPTVRTGCKEKVGTILASLFGW